MAVSLALGLLWWLLGDNPCPNNPYPKRACLLQRQGVDWGRLCSIPKGIKEKLHSASPLSCMDGHLSLPTARIEIQDCRKVRQLDKTGVITLVARPYGKSGVRFICDWMVRRCHVGSFTSLLAYIFIPKSEGADFCNLLTYPTHLDPLLSQRHKLARPTSEPTHRFWDGGAPILSVLSAHWRHAWQGPWAAASYWRPKVTEIAADDAFLKLLVWYIVCLQLLAANLPFVFNTAIRN